jgi:hypothetical protein
MRGGVRRERTTGLYAEVKHCGWAAWTSILSLHISRDGGGETAADCSSTQHTTHMETRGEGEGVWGWGREDEVGNATNRRRPRPARAAKRQALPWAGASKALQLLVEASQLYVFKQLWVVCTLHWLNSWRDQLIVLLRIAAMQCLLVAPVTPGAGGR